MRFLLFILTLTSLVSVQHASAAPMRIHVHSAMRSRGETANQAYRRYVDRLRQSTQYEEISQTDSALQVARPLAQLDSSRAPQWRAPFKLTDGFGKVRDARFVTDPEHAGFMRRSSWLFPDDGCFARAQLMHENLRQWGSFSPGKAFIFGNLQVKTPNSPNGSVGWWYHVVPVMKNGQQVVVFDPAIDPRRPLTLMEWVSTMTPDPASVKVAICDGNTYVPSSSCSKPNSQGSRALQDQIAYLKAEWLRVVELKRDPVKELGDNPPWSALYSALLPGWAE
jgi:hypothetical protein